MKREITLGQVLAIAFGVVSSILAAWITITNNQARLDIRVEKLEKSASKTEDKIDEIQRNTTAILVKLEQKENRK